MLRGDAAGRSFYIKVNDDVAATNLAAARAAVVAGLAAQAGGCEAGSRGEAAAACSEAQPAARMYFWLAEPALGPAVHSLGRLKSRECAWAWAACSTGRLENGSWSTRRGQLSEAALPGVFSPLQC